MLTVTLTKGLPGSGKSFWSKQQIDSNPGMYKRINNDDLRMMLDNSKFSKNNEKFIEKVRDNLILMALEDGKHVIVDNTNLAERHYNHIKELVKGKADIIIKDFTDIPIETCIKNDLKRFNSVGEKVIREMYNQTFRKIETYNEDYNLPKAIIVDIDGTLAIKGDRSPYDWAKVGEDKVNEFVKNIVNNYNNHTIGHVIIFSGRDSVCRELTLDWLFENEIACHQLFMRPAGNQEKDSIIKKRLFEENVKGKYFVEYVIDDRLQVCRMWNELGLNLLRVGDPDLEF